MTAGTWYAYWKLLCKILAKSVFQKERIPGSLPEYLFSISIQYRTHESPNHGNVSVGRQNRELFSVILEASVTDWLNHRYIISNQYSSAGTREAISPLW